MIRNWQKIPARHVGYATTTTTTTPKSRNASDATVEGLQQLVLSMTLPNAQVPTFGGDPIDYRSSL
jgi:hypothetical protein